MRSQAACLEGACLGGRGGGHMGGVRCMSWQKGATTVRPGEARTRLHAVRDSLHQPELDTCQLPRIAAAYATPYTCSCTPSPTWRHAHAPAVPPCPLRRRWVHGRLLAHDGWRGVGVHAPRHGGVGHGAGGRQLLLLLRLHLGRGHHAGRAHLRLLVRRGRHVVRLRLGLRLRQGRGTRGVVRLRLRAGLGVGRVTHGGGRARARRAGAGGGLAVG